MNNGQQTYGQVIGQGIVNAGDILQSLISMAQRGSIGMGAGFGVGANAINTPVGQNPFDIMKSEIAQKVLKKSLTQSAEQLTQVPGGQEELAKNIIPPPQESTGKNEAVAPPQVQGGGFQGSPGGYGDQQSTYQVPRPGGIMGMLGFGYDPEYLNAMTANMQAQMGYKAAERGLPMSQAEREAKQLEMISSLPANMIAAQEAFRQGIPSIKQTLTPAEQLGLLLGFIPPQIQNLRQEIGGVQGYTSEGKKVAVGGASGGIKAAISAKAQAIDKLRGQQSAIQSPTVTTAMNRKTGHRVTYDERTGKWI